ncbi:MAG TPA: lipid-A-disaccharide synthase [Candidatus Krumholzibacteria bacterium]|nr:lipid-A-disaccharide synthase [Candidatus Krumholzibacteria bacterium]
MASPPRIVLCAGELSGDMHAAHVVSALFEALPGAHITGMAGALCAGAGMDVRFQYRDYAVIGFTGILSSLPRFHRLERSLRTLIDDADLFIAVDYPGLNLRLCEYAHARGKRVLYYIAPQVWAWGAGRVQRMRRIVDRVAVVLPFETKIYRDAGIDCEFVGHPFITDHDLPAPLPEAQRDGIALLPGSRPGEVASLLPLFLNAARRLRERHPGLRVAIGRSPVVSPSLYDEQVARSGLDLTLGDGSVGALSRARVALVASGTATLESALLETPLVIAYRTGRLNYALARRLVRIPDVGLVNVLLGERVAPELVQNDATPEALANALESMLTDGARRDEMRRRFRGLRDELARGAGSTRVAQMAGELLA